MVLRTQCTVSAESILHDEADKKGADDVDTESAIRKGAAETVMDPDGDEITGQAAGCAENGYGYYGKH